VDLTDTYSPRLRAAIREMKPDIGEGVYAGWYGPAFETPAEIEMMHRLGADMVGMSTVLEAIAAREGGAEVVGLSLVTNRAAGLAGKKLSGEEVLEVAKNAIPRLRPFLDGVAAAVLAESR
jgi:purine-nucleoside phosphorylase